MSTKVNYGWVIEKKKKFNHTNVLTKPAVS